jgi:hypothetical protein
MSKFNGVIEEDEIVYGEYMETIGKKTKNKKESIPYYELFE